MQEAKIPPAVECLRCGHKWVPRVPLVRICAHCKSAHWDVPKPVPINYARDQGEENQNNPS